MGERVRHHRQEPGLSLEVYSALGGSDPEAVRRVTGQAEPHLYQRLLVSLRNVHCVQSCEDLRVHSTLSLLFEQR